MLYVGVPWGCTIKQRLLTLFLTKLFLRFSHLHRPQVGLQQGLTNFRFGKRLHV